jgi:hypothetical protein
VPDRDFPHASIVEGVRFTAQVAVPNLVQGLFRRRRTAVSIAEKVHADGLAHGFMAGLKRSYGEGPVWIRVAAEEVLLLLGRGPIRHVLEAAPDPFAPDPEPKRSAMGHFQPDALTISRGSAWVQRREFTEAVLATGEPVHPLADGFVAAAGRAAGALPEELDWEDFNEAVRRVARTVILGDAAAGDAELSRMLGELMDKSNPPGRGDPQLLERYTARLAEYVAAGDPRSLVGRFGSAPVGEETKPANQVTHWLFALGDTLAINAARCLALLAVHDEERARVLEECREANLGSGAAVHGLRRLEACLHEAMRLWPTTPMLSREAVRESEWDGVSVPAGTQVMIVNAFNHRDREAVEFADDFSPEAWLSGEAAGDWTFNHFSHGPAGCPGTALALLVGQAMLATVLREREVELRSPELDPDRPMPRSLDHFSLRFRLAR